MRSIPFAIFAALLLLVGRDITLAEWYNFPLDKQCVMVGHMLSGSTAHYSSFITKGHLLRPTFLNILNHFIKKSIYTAGLSIPFVYLRVGQDWVTSISLFTFMHWRRKWQPTPVFLPGESQGQRSLVGYCLWGRTESDTTEATWHQQQQHEIFSVFPTQIQIST